MNIPKARWDHLLAMERGAAERETVRLGFTIEDYNQLRKAFMEGKLKDQVEIAPKPTELNKAGRKPAGDHKQIVNLYLEGKKVYEIINITGVSEPTIRRVLKANLTSEQYPRVSRQYNKKAKVEVKPTEKPIPVIEVKEIPPAPKIESKELFIPELDYIAAKLTKEELIGYVKGNVMECLFKDTMRAEVLLKWLNTKGINCYE